MFVADFIQSKVEVIHKVEATKPTGDEKPTDPNVKSDDSVDDIRDNTIKGKGGVVKFLGKASVQRRLVTQSTMATNFILDLVAEEKARKEAMFGDVRAAQKIRNQQARRKAVTSYVSSLAVGVIMAKALRTPSLALFAVTNEAIKVGTTWLDITQRQRTQREKMQLDMFTSSKRRDRVIVGTYNRR